MDWELSIGDRMSKSMHSAGLSIGELAQWLEEHRDLISDWIESRAQPTAWILRDWAHKTNVEYGWLLFGV